MSMHVAVLDFFLKPLMKFLISGGVKSVLPRWEGGGGGRVGRGNNVKKQAL